MRCEISAAMRECRSWLLANPEAWLFMVRHARRLARDGYVFMDYLVSMVRNELHVSIERSMAWPLARVLESNFPELRGKIRTR